MPGGNDLGTDWTYVSPAYAQDWVARNAEIVQKYQPEVIFFDWWIGQPSIRPYVAEFAAYYYNESLKHGPVGVITYKLVDMQKTSAVLDLERGQMDSINSDYWQTDTSVSNKTLGIHRERYLQVAYVHRASVGRCCEQERKSADERRSALRRDNSR